MPAAAAPPPSAPASSPSLPKPGPSVAAVTMPAPPALDSAPKDAPSGVGDMFDKYAKPPEEGLTHKNNTPKPADKPKEEAPKAETAEPESGESPAPRADKDKTETANPPEGEPATKGGKKNGWSYYNQEKEAHKKTQQDMAELRKLVVNETERKGEIDRLAKAESRAKELEDHLRFIDYQNHPEFHEKHQKPYDDAWNRVMRRLNGVRVPNPDGSARAVDVKDIMELGSLPADVIIEKAEEKFGKLGPWVAERVEEIKQLGEAKADALSKAKTDGLQKLKDDESRTQKQQKEIKDFANQMWEKAHKELSEHSKYSEYFKPKEGDDEHNEVLEKGAKFVEKAWMESPLEPGTTNEEREARVKRQAKMQKFVQGFGVQHLTINRQKAEIERLTAELAKFKSSEPKTEGQRPESNGTPAGYDMNSFEQALLQRARPGVI